MSYHPKMYIIYMYISNLSKMCVLIVPELYVRIVIYNILVV